MKIFERPELWWLMALATAGGLFVLVTQRPADADAFVTDVVQAESEQVPVLKGLTLTRDYQHARLDVDVKLTNPLPRNVPLVAPMVRLLAEKGREVPLFFLPSQPPPSLPAKSSAEVKLRFWLDASDLQGKLQLEFHKQRISIKSDAPYSLEKLTNGEPQTLSSEAW
jgi:hypothetical protein